jgi:hypothetical protein
VINLKAGVKYQLVAVIGIGGLIKGIRQPPKKKDGAGC